MDESKRMCSKWGCSRKADPVSADRCESCGNKTEPWDTQRAYDLAVEAGKIRVEAPAATALLASAVLIVTTNDIPGYRVAKVHGDVFGLVVRARNMFSNYGAHLRTIVGGEVGGYTKLLTDSRNQARGRLKDAARDLGANAVLAMRFDCNEIGDIMTEIAAYGTAVTVEESDGNSVGSAGGS